MEDLDLVYEPKRKAYFLEDIQGYPGWNIDDIEEALENDDWVEIERSDWKYVKTITTGKRSKRRIYAKLVNDSDLKFYTGCKLSPMKQYELEHILTGGHSPERAQDLVKKQEFSAPRILYQD